MDKDNIQNETESNKENTLEVIAAIESVDDDTWRIRVMNKETKEVAICDNVLEYSAFLQEAVSKTSKDYFKATWFPSNAKAEHIAQVREELFKYQDELAQLDQIMKDGEES